jgi:LmbE family N-acetylglucosaminyl deacetylase
MGALVAPRITGAGTAEAAWQAWGGLERLTLIDLDTLVPATSRAVIVAPHPDDEVLATGGLISLLAEAGRSPLVVAVTDGTASHPSSPSLSQERLGTLRTQETSEALRRLGSSAVEIRRLRLPDGQLEGMPVQLESALASCINESDIVFSTWRNDGHPDHEATGLAAANVAERKHAKFVEAPVWAWHWAKPADHRIPWHRTRRLFLGSDATRRKRQAIAEFVTQVTPGFGGKSAPVLDSGTLARLLRPFEVYFL